jgi:Predicted permease, DMT superfamily
MSVDSITLRQGASGTSILLMVLAMALVPMIDVQAKLLVVGGLPAMQVVFLRMLCGTLLLFPLMLKSRPGEIIPPQGWRNASLLGLFSILGGFFFFGALKYLSIADTVAISFVQPLFVTLFSNLFLKERVGASRWIALVVGFCATLLIIRPSFASTDIGSFLALGAGLSMACYAIVVKKGTIGVRRVSPITLCFQTHFTAVAVAAPVVIFFWNTPSLFQWAIVLGMTLVGLVGQYLIIKAYDLGDASLVAPFAYIEIITSTMVSWFFFREIPDHITFAGVAILICSSLYIAWRR